MNYPPRHQHLIKSYFHSLVQENYTEEPVEVIQFLSDPHYLGNSTRNGEDVFPKWKSVLTEMFSDNYKYIAVLTGSTGTGKSTVALWAIAYIQYRLMILKNPWGFFSLAPSGKMTISFFNLNKTLGDSRGYRKMMMMMAQSPWFRKNAEHISKTRDGENLDFKLIKYVLASPYAKGFGIVGEDVVSGVLDEVDSPIESIKQKERVLETYSATSIRFKNRFAQQGYSLGKLFIVSSKQDELSFIDTFVAERKNSPEVMVFDIPLWEAKPDNTFSGETFPVAVGDAYNPPKIIEESEVVQYIQNGYKIIRPPMTFKQEFQLDLIRSLRDIAGVTVAGSRKSKLFASEKFIIDCFDNTKEDPVAISPIMVGLDDPIELIKNLDTTKFRMPKSTPRFIHFDIAFSGDAAGLSMAGVKDWTYREVENQDGTFRKEVVPVIETDFTMRIKARPGDRIPTHKIRKLVLDLRQAGYHIFRFTADLQLASEDTLQLLRAAGIETECISLDKTNGPYFDFRNLVYERRWICHRHQYLLFELKNLEQSALDGKIDHPKKVQDMEFLVDGGIKEVVMEGTKDMSDATVGAVIECIKHAGTPMDTKLMADLLRKSGISNTPKQEDLTNLLPLRDSRGDVITGTKEGENINKINDIFKRMHGK